MRELPQQGEIPTVRVGVRGNPEPAHLPMLAGIEATLRLLDGEEIAAPNNRPPEPAPRGSAMATADPDGEHVRLELEVSGARASLRLDPLLALRLGGEVLDAVGLVMRPVLTGLRRAARESGIKGRLGQARLVLAA